MNSMIHIMNADLAIPSCSSRLLPNPTTVFVHFYCSKNARLEILSLTAFAQAPIRPLATRFAINANQFSGANLALLSSGIRWHCQVVGEVEFHAIDSQSSFCPIGCLAILTLDFRFQLPPPRSPKHRQPAATRLIPGSSLPMYVMIRRQPKANAARRAAP